MKKGDFKAYLSAYHNEVTGSGLVLHVYFPDGRDYQIGVDKGYFQEVEWRHLNYVDDIDPRKIDAFLITHNHIDHTGLLPKMVRNGYRNPIYMTTITNQLLPKFLYDSCDQQEDNAKYLKQKYPEEEWKFQPLYYKDDVENTLNLCKGIKYNRRFEVIPGSGIFATFLENGHILGASIILIECVFLKRKPLNFLFTGDYRMQNTFYKVPSIPKLVRNMELIMVHEATYGTTSSDDIKICFEKNIVESVNKRRNILIGAFAQGRMQEILYRIKCMVDQKKIPDDYRILVDGPLGIATTKNYIDILSWYNPRMANFIPRVPYGYDKASEEDKKEMLYRALNEMVVNPKARESVLDNEDPVILITTSGMLSNGPAKMYVPMFLENSNAMIHLTGYAAEETLARTLLEAKRNDTVTIGGEEYQKKAIIKTTREMTSHTTMDEMLEFIDQFKNIQFLGINHGSQCVKEVFINHVAASCDKVANVDMLDRDNMYCIYQFGKRGQKYSSIVVKHMPACLNKYPSPREDTKVQIERKKKDKRKKKSRAAGYKKKKNYRR